MSLHGTRVLRESDTFRWVAGRPRCWVAARRLAADHGVGGGSGDGRKLQIMLPMSPMKASMTATSDFRCMGTSSATTIEVWSDEVAAL